MTDNRKFSFFPNPGEVESLNMATPSELAAIFTVQQDMIGRFIHELIRQGRVEELKAALQQVADIPSIGSAILNDVITSLGVMQLFFQVSEEDAKKFVETAAPIFLPFFPELKNYSTEIICALGQYGLALARGAAQDIETSKEDAV